jgi:hypothetical protein
MSEAQPQPIRVLGDKVWCPFCTTYVHLVKVTTATRIVDVDRRAVYNYVKRNKVFGIRIAQGTTLRVCTSCLMKAHDIPDKQTLVEPT